MGKYSKYKDTMTRFQQEPSWQEEIDKHKKELATQKNADIASRYSELKDQKKELEEKIKAMNAELEACSQILVDRLETDGTSSFKLTNGTSFFIKDDPYSSVQDKPALYKYLKENGMEDLFSVNYQTLSAIMKERLENGEELLPGVAVYMKTSIQRRTSKA
jgi:phage host-nuclease inhibitor protein Gam